MSVRWGIVLLLGLAPLTSLVGSDEAQARDLANSEHFGWVTAAEVAHWLRGRFSETELEAFQPKDLQWELRYCSCYDKPKPHFPYAIALLKTPKGDLMTRLEPRDGALRLTALAVRHGTRYCEVETEVDCYGSFPEPCDFTDFRFGPYLEEFFPDCRVD